MARPAKRRASSPSPTSRRMSVTKPIYSTREPTLEEKLTLPQRFRAADAWPILRIISERAGKYQVEWEPHPNTREIWKPEWKKPRDVGDEQIAKWKEQNRKAKEGPQKSTNPASGSNTPRGNREGNREGQGPSKRLKLTFRGVSSDTPVHTSRQETSTSDSPQTPITRSRQRRRVILSSPSPSAEIQETQQQSSSATDSIQVNVPQDNHINPEEYQTIPNSSASIELRNSNHASTASTRDQEADSALGLSSPIGDGSRPNSASFVDQGDLDSSETFGSQFNTSGSQILTPSTQCVDSQRPKGKRTAAGVQATSATVQESIPIEASPNHTSPKEGEELPHSATDTSASSPLFYPDPREEIQDSATPAAPSLTSSQGFAQVQVFDTSEQQTRLQTILSQTSNDSLPILESSQPGQNRQSPLAEPLLFATPGPIVRRSSVRRSASQNPSAATKNSATDNQLSPRPFNKPASPIRPPPPTTPVRQLPKARLFQHSNLSISLQQPVSSITDMSARSRESSPRIGRPAPSAERGAPSASLRESLIKSTAPARAFQQKRHQRDAARSASRAASTATDSTRNSIPARTANTSPMRPQTDMSSNLPLNRAFDPNGAFTSSMQVDDSEPALVSSISPAISVYNSALGSSALPLHPSIEDEQSLPQITRPSLPSTPILGPGEYVVPLPAEGKIKDHYLECIRGKRRTLMKFTRSPKSTGRANNSRVNAEEAEQMRLLINRLNDTTTHLDLGLDGPATQYSDNSVNEATWTYYASSKFAFLYHLVESLRYQDCCLVIFAKEGMTLDLLEKYMKANHVKFRRPPKYNAASTVQSDGSTGSIQVDLIASNSDLEIKWHRRPVLIMAFDTSFDPQEPHVRQIREQFASDGQLISIIYPMILNSAEHVDICVPKNMPSPQRFQMVVQTTFRARDSLGGDPVMVTSPPLDSLNLMNFNQFIELKKSLGKRFTMIAEAVARAAVSDNFDAKWVVPSAALELEPLSDSSSGINTVRSPSPQSRAGTPSVQKRLLERDSASSVSSKRQRRTPVPDVTHISDSLKDSQPGIETLRLDLRKAEESLALEKKARIAAEALLASKEEHFQEIKTSLGDLQTRYETRMKSCHQFKRENQKLQIEKENLERKQEKLSADMRGWKEQVTQLRAELAAAREALKDGGGSVADLEIARAEVRRLTEKNASLEKSYANMQKDFEFTRSQYQEASTKAVEFASQVSELESQSADLKRQASDEKRRLKEINYQKDLEQHLARVLELEQLLKQRETILQRKEEELKALKKGRGVATRGSSVQPASPRPAGSRGGSPAPGLLGPGTHPSNRASALRHER